MRIGLISDIHEDIDSLTKAFVMLDKSKVDHVACLGDIVGFSVPYYSYIATRNASACIQLIKNNCKWIVPGNHDLNEIKQIPKYKAGFEYPENWFQLDYLEKKSLAQQNIWLYEENSLDALISESEKSFLAELNPVEFLEWDGYKVALSHFLYPDISGTRANFYLEYELFNQHLEFLKQHDCDFSFNGHAHREGLYFVNREKASLKKFGKYKIKQNLQAHLLPCIARGKNKNGFTIFDTKSMQIQAVRLK